MMMEALSFSAMAMIVVLAIYMFMFYQNRRVDEQIAKIRASKK